MNQEQKQLYKEFEKEVWLFLDKELPEERMVFWQKQLENIPQLKNCIDEYRYVSAAYDKISEIDIGEEKFNSIIDSTVSRKSFETRFRNIFEKLFSTDSELSFGKIAFASAMIIAAVLISFLSNKPNPVVNITNSINNELLEWDADFVDNQIDKVGTLLKVAGDDDYRKYYKYKLNPSNVDKNINLMNANIKTLKEELNNKEL